MKKTHTSKVKEEYDITIEEVLSSGLLPEAPDMAVQYLGNNWFKENITGIAYLFSRDADGSLTIKETRDSIKKEEKPKRKVVSVPRFVTIKCIECGAEREIHVQDAFQVKRCITCQKKHRNVKRLARLKEKRALKEKEIK